MPGQNPAPVQTTLGASVHVPGVAVRRVYVPRVPVPVPVPMPVPRVVVPFMPRVHRRGRDALHARHAHDRIPRPLPGEEPLVEHRGVLEPALPQLVDDDPRGVVRAARPRTRHRRRIRARWAAGGTPAAEELTVPE